MLVETLDCIFVIVSRRRSVSVSDADAGSSCYAFFTIRNTIFSFRDFRRLRLKNCASSVWNGVTFSTVRCLSDLQRAGEDRLYKTYLWSCLLALLYYFCNQWILKSSGVSPLTPKVIVLQGFLVHSVILTIFYILSKDSSARTA